MMNWLMLLAAAQLGGDLAWEWARPSGLWALFLPVILWVFSRLRALPPAVPTGTLVFWKRVAAAHPKHGRGSQRRTPPWAWCLIAALLLGTLGLAGPRLIAPDAPRTWTVVVDHSPSTSLVLANGETRLGRALDRARELLVVRMQAEDSVVWISSAHGLHEPSRGELGRGELPPGRWLLHPAWFAPEPRWEFFDFPGALWITDAVPAVVPAHAALIASGGDLVPGTISASGTTRFDWDGEEITPVEQASARRALVLSGPLPEPVAALARLWAEERGLRVTDTAERDQALEIRVEARPAATAAVVVAAGVRA